MIAKVTRVEGYLGIGSYEEERYVLFIPLQRDKEPVVHTEWSSLVRLIDAVYPEAWCIDTAAGFPDTCVFEYDGQQREVEMRQVGRRIVQALNACIVNAEEFL